jgi:hypothetical protein
MAMALVRRCLSSEVPCSSDVTAGMTAIRYRTGDRELVVALVATRKEARRSPKYEVVAASDTCVV